MINLSNVTPVASKAKEGGTPNIIADASFDLQKAVGSVELDLAVLEHAKKTSTGKESYVSGWCKDDTLDLNGKRYQIRVGMQVYIKAL